MKRVFLITGVVLAGLSAAMILFTNLPAPRNQVELSLVSQQYLPQQSVKLRIDMPTYLLLAKEEPLHVDLSLPGRDKPVFGDQELVASARLDAPELVSSTEEAYEPIFPAMKASFGWTLNAHRPGVYRGVLWIFLQKRGDEGKGHEVLLAHPLELPTRSIAGIPTDAALWIGILGVGVGVGVVIWAQPAR